mmetsp:Transcript_13111/g.15406  ORF Transcript_13111/g.15406 Transcript_13111/m.15406 type:complete len:524 (+) Transcript_13111:2-1573(+)
MIFPRSRYTLSTAHEGHQAKRNLKRRRFQTISNSVFFVLLIAFLLYFHALYRTITKITPNTFPVSNPRQSKRDPKVNQQQTSDEPSKSVLVTEVVKVANNTEISANFALSTEEGNRDGVRIEVPSTFLQKVYVIPDLPPSKATGEYNHFLVDGLKRSSLLERTSDPYDRESIWLVDLTKIACNKVVGKLVQDRWDHMLNESTAAGDSGTFGGNDGENIEKKMAEAPERRTPWKIFFIDFGDDNYRGSSLCAIHINTIFNSKEKYVHIASRKTMLLRDIHHEKGENDEVPFNSYGKKRKTYGLDKNFNGTMRILRYGVRSDLVNSIKEIIDEKKTAKSEENLDIVMMRRPKDVIHFWNHDSAQAKGTASHRTFITKRLNAFGRMKKNAHRTIFTGLVGEARMQGRQTVQRPYAEALLEYKIVVVCQRDRWEDHYRLMEALAAGALVMTDPMHPLPYGINDKEQVIVYGSFKELKQNIIFYLQNPAKRLKIARSGHEVAMKKHRSDQWLERIIYGNWSASNGAYE